jgi:hypothetical protein
MGGGTRPASIATVCIRDDSAKTFEFRQTSDSVEIVARVAAAVAKGRHLRCYTLCYTVAAGEQARGREERYLQRKGYKNGVVNV